MSLPLASAHVAGFRLMIKDVNGSYGLVLAAQSTESYFDAAAATLAAAGGAINLMSGGSTIWYKTT
jgi:hypothetical protein